LYATGAYDYVYNRLNPGYPDGLDVQVFSVDALDRISAFTRDPIDRVHVSSYFRTNPGKFRLGGPKLEVFDEEYWPDLGITLDEDGDYRLLARIFDSFYPTRPEFDARDVLRLLRANPDWISLNRDVRRKELHEG
jgi:spore coat polysaccharide biosynthesis protein SpsF